jgi:hypothetical protein
MEMLMAMSIQTQPTEISERMIEEGRRYLSRCGALDDPSLILYRGFVQDMLERTIERSGELWGPINEPVEDRALDYFFRFFDMDNPTKMTQGSFVHGLLTYALLGQSAPVGSANAIDEIRPRSN